MAYQAWDHDQWELWSVGLVRERFGHANVVDVPDGAGGDHGLEAYTRDGIAFQCYSSEKEPLKPSDRGALQKSKIGKDLKKFREGGPPLQALLGTVKIHTWVLLTPYHEDAAVIPYCNDQAVKVDDAKLAYAVIPFAVTVHHLETYRAEHESLLKRAAMQSDLALPPPRSAASDFVDATSGEIQTMDTKLARLSLGKDPVRRARLRSALLSEQVCGGNLLDRWTNRVPEVASHIQHVLDTARDALVLDAVGVPGPEDQFKAVRADVRRRVAAASGGLSAVNVEHVADMALAYWLQSCHLDFVEV